jgi:hypothetical protein
MRNSAPYSKQLRLTRTNGKVKAKQLPRATVAAGTSSKRTQTKQPKWSPDPLQKQRKFRTVAVTTVNKRRVTAPYINIVANHYYSAFWCTVMSLVTVPKTVAVDSNPSFPIGRIWNGQIHIV